MRRLRVVLFKITTMSDSTDEAPTDAAGPGHRSPIVRRLPEWITLVALVIALIAVGLAGWAVWPAPANKAARPSAQQVTDAKARGCGAFTTVTTAVSLQTHANLGPDPAGVQAVAANARLAMAAGGPYLLAHVDSATPAPLAGAIRDLANDLQDIAMSAMAGVGNDDPAQAARLRDGQAVAGRIAELCR